MSRSITPISARCAASPAAATRRSPPARRALELNPDQAGALSNVGIALFEQGKFEEALEHLRSRRRARARFRAGAQQSRQRAAAAQALRRSGAAYRRALELQPDFADAWNNLGTCLRELKRPEEAESRLSQGARAASRTIPTRSTISRSRSRTSNGSTRRPTSGLIRLALPNAKIIHTVRDPIDTCISRFSKLFSAEQNHTYDLGEVGRYYRRYERLMAHWHRVLPTGTILDVRYEDVVADFETQARRIIAHCSLSWHENCLSFHKTERPVRTASATQVRQPIYNSAIGRWRVYEQHLGPLLDALDRNRATPGSQTSGAPDEIRTASLRTQRSRL